MQRRLIPAAVAALALAAAPAAGAKEISNAEVCGANGCAGVSGEADRLALMTGSGKSIAAPPEAPYYEASAVYSHGGQSKTVGFVAVPRHRAVSYEGGPWYEITPAQSALISKLAGDRQPFPAAGLTGAAPAPDPKPAPVAASDGGNLLWPEGVLLALALGVFLIRPLRAAARTATLASRRRARAAR